MVDLTKSQVDKLGERLMLDPIRADDLPLLEVFRESFQPAFQTVLSSIERSLRAPVSGRGAKSVTAIVAKLRRERTRLSRMQDIAGCRILVDSLADQDHLTDQLATLFHGCRLIDRRAKPSFGYRAVHVIITLQERPVEVQVRTELQHRWAQLSERLADIFGAELKYGGGPDQVRQRLIECSHLVEQLESREPRVVVLSVLSVFDRMEHDKQAEALKAHFDQLIQMAESQPG